MFILMFYSFFYDSYNKSINTIVIGTAIIIVFYVNGVVVYVF